MHSLKSYLGVGFKTTFRITERWNSGAVWLMTKFPKRQISEHIASPVNKAPLSGKEEQRTDLSTYMTSSPISTSGVAG